MLEILAYYCGKGGSTLPNAMKKGFSRAFDRFDAYQLAKELSDNNFPILAAPPIKIGMYHLFPLSRFFSKSGIAAQSRSPAMLLRRA